MTAHSTTHFPDESFALGYDGRAGHVAAIALINALLGLLTLGFYRFWGKTRMRRYLWSRIVFDDDRFEYTGRGMELLLGFLVAIAILVPLGGLASMIQVAFAANEAMLLVSGLVQAVVFVYLIQFALYRARRYRLSRTQWRGIRAGQSGSALAYAAGALAWMAATAATLGLAYPVMRTRLQRYRTENTWFGNQALSFEARDLALLGRWLLAVLLLIPTLGVSYAWYRASEFRYFTKQTRYGDISFESDLSTGRVVLIWLQLMLTFAAILVFVALVATLVMPGLMQAIQTVVSGDKAAAQTLVPMLTIIMVVAVLAVGILFGVARFAVFVHPMLNAICESLTIQGTADFAAIRQSQQARPQRGEGFADALDVGSI